MLYSGVILNLIKFMVMKRPPKKFTFDTEFSTRTPTTHFLRNAIKHPIMIVKVQRKYYENAHSEEIILASYV